MPNFDKISSVESTFDTLNNFYKDFIKLQSLKVKAKKESERK